MESIISLQQQPVTTKFIDKLIETPNTYEAWSKRLLDLIVASGALILLAPIFLFAALAIRLDSPGPLFFHQTRVGYRGKLFTMLKFRSMYTDAEARQQALLSHNEMDCGKLFKMKNDPRITRVGRWLRRLSIDELPQLINVLRGDMTLVGPRPALPKEVALYSASDAERLRAVPGITCLWQVSGRSDLPFEQQVLLDKRYIATLSLKTDLTILLRTVPAVLSGRGAY
ncbi:MAG: sugar transferase [Candidatus Competibacterales bacterium]